MFFVVLKHFMYELGIDILFERIEQNFPRNRLLPVIGERYRKVIDIDMRETFYDYQLLPIEELSYYSDMSEDSSEEEINNFAFAMTFTGYIDNDSNESDNWDGSEPEETYFTKDEIPNLIFIK